jgi:hypothetical protein
MNNDFTIRPPTNQNKNQTEFYTLIGHHEYIDEQNNPRVNKDKPNVCAKKIVSDQSTKFFIKTGIYGKIYDPIGLYSEGTAAKFLARAGKKAWEFKQVNSKVFEMYLSFLRTKNKAWLTNAERELN